MGKKSRKFTPTRVPRYLIGSVKKDVWMSDLIEYNQHRYRVYTAVSRTDDKPPKLNPYTYLKVRSMVDDVERLTQIDKSNKDLLKAINMINRTMGKVDSYNPHAYADNSRWKMHEREMKEIELMNKDIYHLIMTAKSNYTVDQMNRFWKSVVKNLQGASKFPLVILEKSSADALLAKHPSISGDLEKFGERPLCFLEFRVKDGPFLGRVIVELYHDHLPVTVQNFQAICSGEKLTYKNCLVHRIIPGRYCELGDITLGTGKGGKSIYGEFFPEERHILKHTRTGVLSMVRVKGQENNSQFCISFTKMETLDRKNVVFGKIIKGIDNFLKLEGYGRHIGKPLAEVIISDCGNL